MLNGSNMDAWNDRRREKAPSTQDDGRNGGKR